MHIPYSSWLVLQEDSFERGKKQLVSGLLIVTIFITLFCFVRSCKAGSLF